MLNCPQLEGVLTFVQDTLGAGIGIGVGANQRGIINNRHDLYAAAVTEEAYYRTAEPGRTPSPGIGAAAASDAGSSADEQDADSYSAAARPRRRRSSHRRVANRWGLSEADAAELCLTVESAQGAGFKAGTPLLMNASAPALS